MLHRFWCHAIADHVRAGANRVTAVVFPQYQPELIAFLAKDLGFALQDFRYEVMRPLGWSAGKIPLARLDQEIMTAEHDAPGLVLANAEALLAAKTDEERAAWLAGVFALAPPRPVVLPLALYGSLLTDSVQEHVITLSEEDLLGMEALLAQ